MGWSQGVCLNVACRECVSYTLCMCVKLCVGLCEGSIKTHLAIVCKSSFYVVTSCFLI